MTSPKGWYPDPDGKPSERYWNGKRWTSKTRPVSKPKEKSKYEKNLEKQNEARKVMLENMSEKERKIFLDKEKARNKKIALYGCLPLTLLFLGGCVALLNSGDSSVSQVTPEVAITTSAPEPSEEIDLQEDAKSGGFTESDIVKIKNSRSELYSFVESWAGLVAGNVTSAEVSIYCSNLEDTNNRLRNLSSSSPYFEDLLDRVKDYVYETRSECEYAFKKNRLENLGQAAEYAGTGIAFFDRIISEAESNQ